MAVTISIRLPRSVAEKLKEKARETGLGLEEYVLELALRDLDPA